MRVFYRFVILIFLASCSSYNYDAAYDNIAVQNSINSKIFLTISSKKMPHEGYSSKKIFIFPATQEISIDDSNFRLYADFLYASLEERGYKIANTPDKAEIAILLYYGASLPLRKTLTHTVPVNTNQLDLVPYDTRTDPRSPPIIRKEDQIRRVNDYHVQTEVAEIYERVVTVVALDMLKYRENNYDPHSCLIWQTEIKSSGKSNDLGILVPHMIVGAGDFFGKNIEDPIQTYIKIADRRFVGLSNVIRLQKSFTHFQDVGDQIKELFYMKPPTSRPYRLRRYEEAMYQQF